MKLTKTARGLGCDDGSQVLACQVGFLAVAASVAVIAVGVREVLR